MVKKLTILKVIQINHSFYGKFSPDFVKKFKKTIFKGALVDAEIEVGDENGK